jgi:hypothetical protein
MKKLLIINIVLGSIVVFAINACKKNNFAVDKNIVPPTFVKFNTLGNADTIATYFVRDVNNVYKIPIGITTVSDKDRTIQITYSSKSAVQGTQYNAPATITIPAGKALDTLTIQGLFSGYTSSSRIDTLKITLGSGDVPTSAYKGTYTLYIRKYCNVTINTFAGAYNNTRELYGTSAYGPYTTTITSITSTGTNKARIAVTNIWDTGWGPIEFDLDWSNPSNQTVTAVAKSSGIGDAGDISSSYAGYQVAIRANGLVGSFDACDPVITLKLQLGVAGLGYFSTLYTVTMRR